MSEAGRAAIPITRAVVRAMVLLLLAAVGAGCGSGPSTPSASPISRPPSTPERPRLTQVVSQPTHQLLATLPAVVGGELLGGVQIVNDYLHVGHAVDDVLKVLHKKRIDAVSVFRCSERAMIGATTIEALDGATLFEAFVRTWHAPAVLERRQRFAAGSPAWELRDRGGRLTVIYRLGNIVYLVETTDQALLEAILVDMPPNAPL